MTATDDTALQEQLWESIAEVRDSHPRMVNDAPTDDVVAVVLPIIRAEVAGARARAWDEGFEAFEVAYEIDHTDPWRHLRDNPYRTEQNDG